MTVWRGEAERELHLGACGQQTTHRREQNDLIFITQLSGRAGFSGLDVPSWTAPRVSSS